MDVHVVIIIFYDDPCISTIGHSNEIFKVAYLCVYMNACLCIFS